MLRTADWRSQSIGTNLASVIDHESDKLRFPSVRDCAWVHAYLHRVEGDLWNAHYWYRRSGKSESKLSLIEERSQIAKALLEQF